MHIHKTRVMIKKTCFPHELIGKDIQITWSANPADSCTEGKIIDETKNTFIIWQRGRKKTLLKKNIKFILANGQEIAGKAVQKRPEERIKS